MPILNWIGKDRVINHHRQVPYRALEPLYSHGQPNSGNMIVRGDNLDALKALMPRFEGKVKCVYIDPPYNTGNEGWVYNDNVSDPKINKWLGEVVGKEGEDLSRHDKWLCMMYPRLKLLQRLLADDGAIFISIDDNEQAHLRLICDEIFGANNFCVCIPWQSRMSIQNDTDFSVNHEYILVYAKNRRKENRRLKESNADVWFSERSFVFKPLTVDKSKYDNPDNDHRGLWKADPFDAPNVRPNLTYPITNPNTGKQYLPPHGRHWRISQEKFYSALADNRIVWGKNGIGKPQMKVFYEERELYGSIDNSWFSGERIGTATAATKELQGLFNNSPFDTPKPTTLIEKLCEIGFVKKHDIVLDSFSGSGTTAHAVLNLNRQDNGSRRFILVEMEDYAETITAERVKRVIDGYADRVGLGGGFVFYELGERLLLEDGNLNEGLGVEKIREYVWFTETRADYVPQSEPYLLGVHGGTAYYFYYERRRLTALDHEFLHGMGARAGGYLVYADINALSAEELDAANVRFKKIPRDITRI